MFEGDFDVVPARKEENIQTTKQKRKYLIGLSGEGGDGGDIGRARRRRRTYFCL